MARIILKEISDNYTPKENEIFIDAQTSTLKIGDGVKPKEELVSITGGSSTSEITDVIGLETTLDNKVSTNSPQALHATDAISIIGNILFLNKADGSNEQVDLSLYLDDTNLARIVSGTYVTDEPGLGDKSLKFIRDDESSFYIDASMFFDGTNLVTSVNGGTSLTVNQSTGDVTVNHDDSGVTAGSYGSSTDIPNLTVNSQGHITSISTSGITVGDGTLTVEGTGSLSGSGTFTANQETNNTISISHLSIDGNLHVPATGTTNNGKILTAGATPGSISWEDLPVSTSTSGEFIFTADGDIDKDKAVYISGDGTVSNPVELPPTLTYNLFSGEIDINTMSDDTHIMDNNEIFFIHVNPAGGRSFNSTYPFKYSLYKLDGTIIHDEVTMDISILGADIEYRHSTYYNNTIFMIYENTQELTGNFVVAISIDENYNLSIGSPVNIGDNSLYISDMFYHKLSNKLFILTDAGQYIYSVSSNTITLTNSTTDSILISKSRKNNLYINQDSNKGILREYIDANTVKLYFVSISSSHIEALDFVSKTLTGLSAVYTNFAISWHASNINQYVCFYKTIAEPSKIKYKIFDVSTAPAVNLSQDETLCIDTINNDGSIIAATSLLNSGKTVISYTSDLGTGNSDGYMLISDDILTNTWNTSLQFIWDQDIAGSDYYQLTNYNKELIILETGGSVSIDVLNTGISSNLVDIIGVAKESKLNNEDVKVAILGGTATVTQSLTPSENYYSDINGNLVLNDTGSGIIGRALKSNTLLITKSQK